MGRVSCRPKRGRPGHSRSPFSHRRSSAGSWASSTTGPDHSRPPQHPGAVQATRLARPPAAAGRRRCRTDAVVRDRRAVRRPVRAAERHLGAVRAAPVRRQPSLLDRARKVARALRGRRRAHPSLHDRRRRRRPPPHDDRALARRLAVVGARRGRADIRQAGALPAGSPGPGHRRPRCRALPRPPQRALSAEHGHHRRRRRGSTGCAQAAPTPGVRDQPRRLHRPPAARAARRSRAPDAAGRVGSATRDRAIARHRAGDHRLLKRAGRGHPRDGALMPRARPPGRHRAAPFRARRTQGRRTHGRGSAARRAAAGAAQSVRSAAEAVDRHRRRGPRAPAHRAALRVHRDPDQARLRGAGVLPADAARTEHAAVHGPEVPDDDR